MDPVSALGVAAAVAQFIGVGLKVAQRLSEYTAAGPQDVPRSLQNINAQLPLLLNSLSRVKTEEAASKYDIDGRCMIRGVVVGCLRLVQDVEEIATRLRPQPGENLKVKLKKVLSSLNHEEQITEIDRALQTYIQVLILHQVIDRNEAQVVPLEEHGYFEVREKLAEPYVRRTALLSWLDECLHSSARRQSDRPQFVVLTGEKGVGKSQLALGFCQESFAANQFRTVFWLDAPSPETLQVSLEGAAAAVRRKKDGTRKDKLDFMSQFLTERWEPWLLVLDNYSPAAFIKQDVASMLPREGYGAILIMSTDAETRVNAQTVKVPRFLSSQEELHLRREMTVAVERGDLDAVKTVIAQGFDVNQNDTNGWTFVSRAALRGFEPIVDLLLENGANPNLDPTKRSALGWAAGEGYTSIATLLLDHEDRSNTRLSREQYIDAIKSAMEEGHTAVIKLILSRREIKLNMDERELIQGFSRCAYNGCFDLLQFLCSIDAVPTSDATKAKALTDAVREEHLHVVQLFVSEASFGPDLVDSNGNTALACAAALQCSEKHEKQKLRDRMVSFLLSAGASANLQNTQDGRTALHEAAIRESLSTIDLLLKAGADPTIEDRLGYTPLLLASKYKSPRSFPVLLDEEIPDAAKRERFYLKTLHYTSRLNDRELLAAIVDKVDINAVEWHSGDTALLLAIKNGHAQVARYLIRHGAEQSLDRQGNLPLLLAASSGMDLVTRDLIKAADSPGLQAKDGEGNTALILATKSNHLKVVKELLRAGADTAAENKYGEIALDLAEEKELKDIIEILGTSS